MLLNQMFLIISFIFEFPTFVLIKFYKFKTQIAVDDDSLKFTRSNNKLRF
jgi:hypothetical protein